MSLSRDINLNTNVNAGAGYVGMQMLNKGLQGVDSAIGNYTSRIKNRAINSALSLEQTEGETANNYKARVALGLNDIDMTPQERLGLINLGSEQAYKNEAINAAQSNADRLFNLNQDKMLNDETYRTADLGFKQTNLENTQEYRDNTLGETKRHNSVMESPTDIREAYRANYATGKRVDADGKEHTFLTKKDFAKYQEDKAKARFSQRVLDPSTVDKNKASTIKSFDDILFKQLGEDGYKEYNKLPAEQRTELLQYWLDNGVIDYSMTEENTFSSDEFGQGGASKGYERQVVQPTITQQSGTKTVIKRYPDGSVKYSDGTSGME